MCGVVPLNPPKEYIMRVIDVTPTLTSAQSKVNNAVQAAKPWLKLAGVATLGTAALGVAYGGMVAVAQATYDVLS
jgi:hypothetical protein